MTSPRAAPTITEIELRSNTPLRADDASLLWIVETGSVDLFFQELDDAGEPAGPRRHILRALPGEPIFGMSLGLNGAGATLIAVGAPGTRVRQVPLDVVREPGPDGLPTETALRFAESWIDLLTRVTASDVPPKIYFPLTPGKPVKVPAGRPSVCAGREVVWVSHKAGSSYYLGLSDVLVDGDGWLPMSAHGWLVAAEQSTLECRDSVAQFREDRTWEGLEAFHRLILPVLINRQREEERRESERLVVKENIDRRRMGAALTRLAETLSTGIQDSITLPDAEGSALLLASRIAGQAIGIDIKSPVQSPRTVSKDPLRDIARASSVRTRKVLLRGNWWRDDRGPLVGYRSEGGAPVALLCSKGGYRMHDPVAGTVSAVDREAGLTLEPFAHAFYRPFPNKQLSARDLFEFGLRNCGPN